MQQVKNYDSLHYVSTDGSVAKYEMRLRGTPAFYALVDQTDPTLQIWVETLDSSKRIATAGHAQTVTEYTSDTDGLPNSVYSRVTRWSVESYVKPRSGVLTARLYVPGFEADVTPSE